MQQDQALVTLYQQRKIKKWTKISQLLASQFGIQGKNPKKCRQRYNNHLNPAIRRQDWTKEQENTLLALQKKIGNRWAQISRHLPGRTDNSVKNKFYSKLRKSLRALNSLTVSQPQLKIKSLSISFIYKLVALADCGHKESSQVIPELLNKAEALLDLILRFEFFQLIQYNEQQQMLRQASEYIQYVNLQFKRKAIKKKNSKGVFPSLGQQIKKQQQNSELNYFCEDIQYKHGKELMIENRSTQSNFDLIESQNNQNYGELNKGMEINNNEQYLWKTQWWSQEGFSWPKVLPACVCFEEQIEYN